jgi:hypothetical protein
LTQADYEDINTGGEFMMEFRYANLLNVLMCTMLFGAGIPILYFIAFLFFVVTYWADSLLLFTCYRKPINFSEDLALKSMKWFKYALALHLICGMLMYSNSSILPYASESEEDDFNRMLNGFMPRAITQNAHYKSAAITARGIAYMMFFVVLACIYWIWTVFIYRCARRCERVADMKKMMEATTVSNNFFSCVSFRTLKMEAREVRFELERVIPLINADQKKGFILDDINKYAECVRDKKAEILKQMHRIAKQEIKGDE